MTQPTNSIDSELELKQNIAEIIYGVEDAEHNIKEGVFMPDVEAVLKAIKALYISRKEIEEAIGEVQKYNDSNGRYNACMELRAKLLPPTKGGKE